MGHDATLKFAARKAAAEQLTQQIASGPMLVDSFGRRILQGGVYSFVSPFPIPVTISEITPVLHPGAAPGTHMVTLEVKVQMQVMERVPVKALQLISLPVEQADAADAADAAEAAALPGPLPAPGIVLTDI